MGFFVSLLSLDPRMRGIGCLMYCCIFSSWKECSECPLNASEDGLNE